MLSDLMNKLLNIDIMEDDEKYKYFVNRTNKHIGLVKKAARMIVDKYPEFKKLIDRAEVHDASKFEEPEFTPYIELTWNKFKGIKDANPRTNQATLHHITTNAHHPEFHLKNKEDANINKHDRDKSNKCVDASLMPDLDIAEMIADWQAMGWELGNDAREWFNEQKDVRWHFSNHQVELIDRLLKVFEK